jgi:acetolactate synthase-1/2/3 large subunit
VLGAELLVAALAAEGVTQVYGPPGTTVVPVIDALARQDRVRYLSVRHEQVAAFMADGHARAGAGPAVCLASGGPGAATMATAIANAHDESVPLVVVVGQVPAAAVHRGAFAEMDLAAVFGPITKWCVAVPAAERLAELVQRAVRTAVSGRPGPVLVSVPLDVLTADVQARPGPRFRATPPRPDADGVRAAAGLLSTAARPVIVVGGGVRAVPFDPAVRRLAAALSAPVVTTWSRKDRYPNDDPHFLGALGAGALPVTDAALGGADVVLALGCRFSESTTKGWTLPGPRAQVVHVDIDPTELGRNRVPRIGLVADAGRAAADLATAVHEALAGQRPPNLRSSWTEGLRAQYLEQSRLVVPPSPAGAVTSAQLTAGLAEVVAARDLTLVVDAPSAGTWIQRHIPVRRAGSHHSSAGPATAWGFPAALGVALARPDERVLCLSGDAGFWVVAQDLGTAVRERIPVVTVVADDYGNPGYRRRPTRGGHRPCLLPDHPDLIAFARLHRAHGERVNAAAELVPALHRALDAGVAAVVDVVQDRPQELPEGVAPLPAATNGRRPR